MQAEAIWFAALALSCGFSTASAEQAPVVDTPLSPALILQTDFAEDTGKERTGQGLQALSPHHPPTVEGLQLTGIATGFFIAPEIVLTNFHVAGDCTALTVGNNSEGEEVPAKFMVGDQAVDLAVVSANEAGAKPAGFQMTPSEETGERFSIIGYPEHGLPVLQAELDEVLASPADLSADRPDYPFSGAVRRGNSGSPILDDRGAVVGIAKAKIDTVAVYRKTGQVVDNVGIAIANRTIFAFLQANKIAFRPSIQKDGLAPEQLLQAAHDFVRQIGCWK